MKYIASVIAQIQRDLIRPKYKALSPELDERGKRIWAATESGLLGFGGVAPSRVRGLSLDNSVSKGRNVRKESSRNSEPFGRTVPAPGAFALVGVCSV